MSAFSAAAALMFNPGSGPGTPKRKICVLTGTASYDTNGSVVDLSTGEEKFTKVHGMRVLSVGAHGDDKYSLTFVPGASYSPSLGTIKVRDLSAASDAEVASTTSLAAVTWVVEFTGL